MRHSQTSAQPKTSTQTYSAAEAAAILGFGRSTLLDHVRNGSAAHLRPVRLGRAVRFPKATIDAIAAGVATPQGA